MVEEVRVIQAIAQSEEVMETKEPPRRGRPRDPALDRIILESAYNLMLESGIRGFSVREVARRAGVPKSSIYRRWSTRAELLAAVLARFGSEQSEAPNTGSVRGDLEAMVREQISLLTTREGALARVALEARDDPDLAEVVRDVFERRRRSEYTILERAVARGEVREGVDFDAALDLVQGAVWSRVIAQLPVEADAAAEVVGWALRGIAANS